MNHPTKEEIQELGFTFVGNVDGHEVYSKKTVYEGEFLYHVIGSEGISLYRYPQTSSLEMVAILSACAEKLYKTQ